jgi:IPT/TIG domain-containing protein
MRGKSWGTAIGVLALVATAAAGGSELTLRLRDETAPAGSLVQMKVLTTEVTPISGGRPHLTFAPDAFESVAGIALFAPGGELAGAAVMSGNGVAISYVTTVPFTGDYPVLTFSLALRPGLPLGSVAPVTLDPSSWTLNGVTVASRADTATVTVGGSVAVTDVVPGEGWFPAGTVVSVRGVGFVAGTRVRFKGNRVAARLVGPTEMQFTLGQGTDLTGAELRIDNPDLSRATYYSYLRAVPAAVSQRPVLAATRPVFSGVSRSLATFRPVPAMNPAFQYAGLALQNPNLDRAEVTLELYGADGGLIQSSTRSLESGYSLTLELAELFDGVAPPPGASVRVASSLPIEAFDLLVDERIRSVTPRLPLEAAP